MKKIILNLALISSLFSAQDEDLSKGFYLGAGYGGTFGSSLAAISSGNYASVSGIYDSTYDFDSGYNFYAGYQFNRIVAVELSYKDFGHFDGKVFTQNPNTLNFDLNLGYQFLEDQLRPFVLIGLGLLDANFNTPSLSDDLGVYNTGFGIEYYPKSFSGVGFRFLGESSLSYEGVVAYDELTSRYIQAEVFRTYYMASIGISYKFQP